jgi:hypothetical protein
MHKAGIRKVNAFLGGDISNSWKIFLLSIVIKLGERLIYSNRDRQRLLRIPY